MEESTSDMSVRDLGKRVRVEDGDTKEIRRMRVSSSDFQSEESEMSGVTSEHIFADGSSGFSFEPINMDLDIDFGVNYVDTELDTLHPIVEMKYDSWETLENMLCSQNISVDDQILLRCLNFCYLFPKTYEFHKDDMIQLWMALAFFPFRLGMEDAIGVYFEEFEVRNIFLPSGIDASTGRLRYKLNHSIVDLLHQRHHDEDARIGDTNSRISENTLHSSLPYRSMHSVTLKNLYQAKRLSTLLITHEPGYIHQVPRELFLKLPYLRVLDFSYTNITELPNSIGKLKGLRYLNVSGTPITTLPSSLCSLYQMQTLKLRSCSKLAGLPEGIRNLKDLRHLELDLSCVLVSMPLGLGDLTELQSLIAFVVGKENGCRITELKHMLNLGGTLRILRLENVSSSKEAKGANLDEKIHLQKLELQWTGLHDGFEVLENLKPHTGLGELQIGGYGGLRFPSWIGDSRFSKLATITIHDSKSCEVLPPLGKLPFLSDLCISEMHGVKVIDHQFCGRNMDAYFLDLGRLELGKVSDNLSNANMSQAFPQLKKLTLNGFPSLERWTGIEEGDFPHLKKLNLSSCSKLTALAELSVLKNLLELVISSCPSLESFPNEGLPTSLQNLVILNCPLLKECCQRDWRMLRDIPNLWINYQRISLVPSAPGHTQNMAMNSSDSQIPATLQAQENFGHQAVKITRKDIGAGTTIKRLSKTKNSWTEKVRVTSETALQKDSYYWTKYDQKDVLGAKYPRSYYRCIDHRCSHACQATKEVQRSTEDPLLIDVTYFGNHTCYQASSLDLANEFEKEFQDLVMGESEQNKSFDFEEIKTSESCVSMVEGPQDGHSWRKYGQKDIIGAKYPRNYYRCTQRHVQDCLATKHVQRSDEDPSVFNIIYRGKHTCDQTPSGSSISEHHK